MLIVQKARAGREFEAEVCGDGLADVGEGGAGAEVYAGTGGLAVDQQGRVFARVVGAGKGRIVSVIGGDHHQIVVAHRGFDLRQTRVEVFERSGVAFSVATMAVKHVEVDEV